MLNILKSAKWWMMRNFLFIVVGVSCLIAAGEMLAASYIIQKPNNIVSYNCKNGECVETK